MGEFELIERYFRQPREAPGARRDDVPLGIGDDAAVLAVPSGRQLVAALDTLVEGRHFPADSPPASIGHRALAVNLSDLAAMGAEPAWFLLALTLPQADDGFLAGFARGLFELASKHAVALVGGDTTAGPLTISVQALGTVEAGTALRRDGGRPGDLLFVSGTPGDAAAGLQLAMGAASAAALDDAQRRWLLDRFEFPEPRIALGRALRGLASACIDVSDGLAADAGKLAAASGCGCTLDVRRLPLSPALRVQAGAAAIELALGGGDDYELCFAIAPENVPQLTLRLADVKCPVACIGQLTAEGGVRVMDGGVPLPAVPAGFDHFAAGGHRGT